MSNIFSTIWTDIESIFVSPVAQTFEDFLGFAAGGASAYEIIKVANPANPKGTANDILTIANAAYTELSGTTPPSIGQIDAIFQTFKSNSSTSAFDTIASTLATSLYVFVQKYSGTAWVGVAKAYIYGLQIAATALGGTTPVPVVAVPPATPAAS